MSGAILGENCWLVCPECGHEKPYFPTLDQEPGSQWCDQCDNGILEEEVAE